MFYLLTSNSFGKMSLIILEICLKYKSVPLKHKKILLVKCIITININITVHWVCTINLVEKKCVNKLCIAYNTYLKYIGKAFFLIKLNYEL